MHIGLLKHSYLGDCKVFTLNHMKVLQFKTDSVAIASWLPQYTKYRNYQWKYCLYADHVVNVENHSFLESKENKNQSKIPVTKKIQYNGYYAVSLHQEILARSREGRGFSQEEILYLTYSIVLAWEEWNQFCKSQKYTSKEMNAISSHHVLLNPDGDIKLITPLSSPRPLPVIKYWAPENIPPTEENQNSWNKSITFSIGLIGLEMITMKISEPFYYYKNQNLKFNFEEHSKWLTITGSESMKQLLNLYKILVDQNPWIRLKLPQFKAILHPYSHQILNCSQGNINRKKSSQTLLQYLRSNA